MILFQQGLDRKVVVTGGHRDRPGPAVLPHRRHQLLGLLQRQAVVRCAQTAAGALALVLKADAPVGTLDAAALAFDTNGAEQVELPLPGIGLDGVMPLLASMERQDMPSQGRG